MASLVQITNPVARGLRTAQPALARPWVQLMMLLTVGLVLRMATFGDPHLGDDETFYLLVGHEMHHGAVPYVDIWDRKPLGLFILYWGFAAFPDSVLMYQLCAWLSASFTAFLMTAIAAHWMARGAALMAGLAYLASINVIGGLGGQSPIFYNALVAGGALLVLQYRSGGATWRLYAAMALLGTAITFKQTAAFEAAALGLVAVSHHRNWRTTLVQIVVGAAPFAAIAAWYVVAGHGADLYQAMVTASIGRPAMAPVLKALKITIMLATIGPLIGAAAYSLCFCRHRLDHGFMGPWLAAAILGWASAGYFFDHYALPMLVPLCIIAAAACTRWPTGPVLIAIVLLTPLYLAPPFQFERHRQSRQDFAAMVRAIGPVPVGRGLLVTGGPPLLYVATGTHPLSPLAFPDHLTVLHEKDMGPRPTGAELERVIALRPAAVVMDAQPIVPSDPVAFGRLLHYVQTRCRPPFIGTAYHYGGADMHHLVYSGCA